MASNETLLVLLPNGAEQPVSNYAALEARNQHPIVAFDGVAAESIMWTRVMPRRYSGLGLTFILHVAFKTATGGTARFMVALERAAEADLDISSDDFGAAQSGGGVANGTSGKITKITVVLTPGTQMDSVVSGDLFRIKVTRDATGSTGTDDITTDAQLLAVEVKET